VLVTVGPTVADIFASDLLTSFTLTLFIPFDAFMYFVHSSALIHCPFHRNDGVILLNDAKKRSFERLFSFTRVALKSVVLSDYLASLAWA
jgi:hypothetical protein